MMEKHKGKRRTRAHVIADLSANYVERQALLCGYSVNRPHPDYGIDLEITTFNRNGEVEAGNILVQLKATEALKLTKGTFPCRIDRANLLYWLGEPFPVILIVYDASKDVAYWIYVQNYFQELKGFNLFAAGKSLTVRLPARNVVTPAAVRQFAQFRDRIREQLGEVTHDEGEGNSVR